MDIQVSRPGKLFIAGEYSIIEDKRKAIVASVDKFINIRIKKSEKSLVRSFNDEINHFYRNQLSSTINFEKTDKKWSYIISAIQISEKYLSEIIDRFDDYEINIESELDHESGKKYGLGSSAAVTVALIDGICKYYDVYITKEELFKLSVLATLENSPDNSCGDVAAISYSSLIYYRKFDKNFVLEKKEKSTLKELIKRPWPLLEIKELDWPKEWEFIVGWTKNPASSIDLIKKIKDRKDNEEVYRHFQERSDYLVEKIKEAFDTKDFELLKESIRELRINLLKLSEKFSSNIETKKLKILSDIACKLGYASKLSGAGGGDCGIAIGDKNLEREKLIKEWEKNDISFLDINLFIGD